MKRKEIILKGIQWGIALGLLHFTADFLGACAAIGWLFAPNVDGFLILAVVPTVVILAGAGMGAAAAALFPAKWVRPMNKTAVRLVGVIAFVGIASASYGSRRGRQLQAPTIERTANAVDKTPILWILMDTLRADTLYGPTNQFELAPEIGEFAKDALVFTDAESTAGWTIPATASLFTGIHNLTMDASAGFIPKWAPTIAEHLYAAGYQTHAVVDNVIVEPRTGFGAGFESYFQKSSFRFAFSLPGFRILPEWITMRLRIALKTFYFGAPGVTAEAVRKIEEAGDEPLFLYVHYMDPHAPYDAHLDIAPDPEGAEPIFYYEWRDHLLNGGKERPTPGQQVMLKHRYETEVTYMSRHIKDLLAAWYKRYGKSGLIMFTSDHGEEFLEHGNYGHGTSVHRELVNIPLMFQFPEGSLPPEKAKGLVAEPISLVDVLPTTLHAVGVTPTTSEGDFSIQGQSQWPWLRGDAEYKARPILATHSRNKRRAYRYREQSDVYLKTTYYDGRVWRGFYQLENDPQELTNLMEGKAKIPKIEKALSSRFETAAKGLWHAHSALTEEEKEASEESLRAIGYIQ